MPAGQAAHEMVVVVVCLGIKTQFLSGQGDVSGPELHS